MGLGALVLDIVGDVSTSLGTRIVANLGEDLLNSINDALFGGTTDHRDIKDFCVVGLGFGEGNWDDGDTTDDCTAGYRIANYKVTEVAGLDLSSIGQLTQSGGMIGAVWL